VHAGSLGAEAPAHPPHFPHLGHVGCSSGRALLLLVPLLLMTAADVGIRKWQPLLLTAVVVAVGTGAWQRLVLRAAQQLLGGFLRMLRLRSLP